MMSMIKTRAPLISMVLAILTSACDPYSIEQAKREHEKQKAIAAFEKQQADEQPSNWDESRLLSALTSSDPSNRANAARELGLRRSANARQALRDLMVSDKNSIIVAESELALIRIGNLDDIAAIHDYAEARIETVDGEFLRNLSLLNDSWVDDLLKEAWEKAADNSRRREVAYAQAMRRDRIAH